MKWTSSTISASVHLKTENPIYGECVITVTVCDEAGGAFIELTDTNDNRIRLDMDQLEMVAKVAKQIIDHHDWLAKDREAA